MLVVVQVRVPDVGEIAAIGKALTEKFVPLSVPVTTGMELTTLTLYFVPAIVFSGMVQVIFPEELPVLVPIFIGVEKLPALSDS
jgi:hypothetical protein